MISTETVQQRREELLNQMEDESLAILFTKDPVIKGDGPFFDFPDPNILYLTNLSASGYRLVLYKSQGEGSTYLYRREPDKREETLYGPQPNPEDLSRMSGIQDIRTLEQFETDINSLISDSMNVYFLEDSKHTGMHLTYRDYIRAFKQAQPSLTYANILPLLAGQREIKSSEEIKITDQAMTITATAFSVLFSRLHTIKSEKEIEALLTYIITKHFGTHAYQPICAGGKNACSLHYTSNSAMLGKQDLVLIDAGCERQGYKTDVTRTVPRNGKFSERQRQVYEACLRVQEYAISLLKPKLKLPDFETKVREKMKQELISIDVITEEEAAENPEITKRYFTHRTGHFLGLDVHDPSNNFPDGTLQSGHLFTVEPGIYLPDEQIGVRIEDTVLITRDGCRVLSEQIPKSVKKLERLIKTKE